MSVAGTRPHFAALRGRQRRIAKIAQNRGYQVRVMRPHLNSP
jgi:hypothetical protein